MPASVLLRRSATQGKLPTATQLAAGELAVNVTDGKVFAYRGGSTPTIVQVNPVTRSFASQWQGSPGLSPIDTYEFTDYALLFSQGVGQQIMMFVRVPVEYLTGTQITMRVAQYSPGTSNFVKFQAIASLVRKNADTINSTTNQYVSTNGDQPLSTSYLYNDVTYDLTTSTGTINAISVNPGDVLALTLTRVPPAGIEDPSDLRMVPGLTEILFS